MKIEHKIFESEVKAFDDANLIVEHFISTEHKDRGGDVMRAKGMKIVGKPVVLLLHGRGPMGAEPVAKPLSITIDEFKGQPGILAKTQFFPDEVGQRLYDKVKGGFLPNWSIGYSVDEAKDIVEAGKYAGRDVTKWQLLEYSPVGVPMNPYAQSIKEFLDTTEKLEGPFEVPESYWFGIVEEKTCTGCGACKVKSVIPYKKTPVAPAETKWDGPGEVAKADVAALKVMCVWYDSSKPDAKTSYKGPHHKADGDHALVPAAVKALAAVMMGARGGMNVPDADKAGIMSHVAKHYTDCGMGDPPWKKEAGKTFSTIRDSINVADLLEEAKEDVILNAAMGFIPDLADFFVVCPKDRETERKCATCGKLLWKKFGGEDPPFKPEKIYCKEGCEIIVKPSEDPMKAIIDEFSAIKVQWKAMEDTFRTLFNCHVELDKKLEPLLKTLPPEPEGGKEGEEEHHDNPPEKKTPPRLVVVRDEETPEAEKFAAKARILAIAREVINEAARQEIDRMKGRVH